MFNKILLTITFLLLFGIWITNSYYSNKMIENDKELALLLKSKIITPTIPLEKSKEVTIKESTPLEKTIILT